MLLPDFNTQESQSHLMTARWTFMSCPYHLAKWIISRDDADDTCEILVEWNGRCLCETLCVLICFNLESWTKPAKNKLQSFDPNLLRWQERLQRSLANQGEECKGESLDSSPTVVQPLNLHPAQHEFLRSYAWNPMGRMSPFANFTLYTNSYGWGLIGMSFE